MSDVRCKDGGLCGVGGFCDDCPATTKQPTTAKLIEHQENRVGDAEHLERMRHRRKPTLNVVYERALLAALLELQSMKAEIAECRRDAERYRWLKYRKEPSNRHPHIYQYPRQSFDEINVPQLWDESGYHPDRLDATIDAALAASKETSDDSQD